MLSPDQASALRQALIARPDLDRFDGIALRHVPLKLQDAVPGEVLRTAPPALLQRSGPDAIFGRPTDPACLDGIAAGETWTPGYDLRRLDQAAIIGPDAVLRNDGALSWPSAATAADLERLAQGSPDEAGPIVTTGAPPMIVVPGRTIPASIAHDALFLHNREPGNYGSFLIRQLPQIILAAAYAARHRAPWTCYVTPDRTPFLREALALWRLPPLPCYTLGEICGDLFRSVTFAGELDAEGLLGAKILDSLRARTARLRRRCRSGPNRLFVSRRLAGIARPHYRPLLNEAALIDCAERHGFTAIEPETLTLADQMRLFGGADTVAGPSGSGMLNALFAPAGARVLDLEFYANTVRQHANVYDCSGKHYAFCFGEIIGAEGKRRERPWQLDPQLFEAGLSWALDSSA